MDIGQLVSMILPMLGGTYAVGPEGRQTKIGPGMLGAKPGFSVSESLFGAADRGWRSERLRQIDNDLRRRTPQAIAALGESMGYGREQIEAMLSSVEKTPVLGRLLSDWAMSASGYSPAIAEIDRLLAQSGYRDPAMVPESQRASQMQRNRRLDAFVGVVAQAIDPASGSNVSRGLSPSAFASLVAGNSGVLADVLNARSEEEALAKAQEGMSRVSSGIATLSRTFDLPPEQAVETGEKLFGSDPLRVLNLPGVKESLALTLNRANAAGMTRGDAIALLANTFEQGRERGMSPQAIAATTASLAGWLGDPALRRGGPDADRMAGRMASWAFDAGQEDWAEPAAAIYAAHMAGTQADEADTRRYVADMVQYAAVKGWTPKQLIEMANRNLPAGARIDPDNVGDWSSLREAQDFRDSGSLADIAIDTRRGVSSSYVRKALDDTTGLKPHREALLSLYGQPTAQDVDDYFKNLNTPPAARARVVAEYASRLGESDLPRFARLRPNAENRAVADAMSAAATDMEEYDDRSLLASQGAEGHWARITRDALSRPIKPGKPFSGYLTPSVQVDTDKALKSLDAAQRRAVEANIGKLEPSAKPFDTLLEGASKLQPIMRSQVAK